MNKFRTNYNFYKILFGSLFVFSLFSSQSCYSVSKKASQIDEKYDKNNIKVKKQKKENSNSYKELRKPKKHIKKAKRTDRTKPKKHIKKAKRTDRTGRIDIYIARQVSEKTENALAFLSVVKTGMKKGGASEYVHYIKPVKDLLSGVNGLANVYTGVQDSDITSFMKGSKRLVKLGGKYLYSST